MQQDSLFACLCLEAQLLKSTTALVSHIISPLSGSCADLYRFFHMLIWGVLPYGLLITAVTSYSYLGRECFCRSLARIRSPDIRT